MNIHEPVRAILLDIEGTTTTIDFVYQTLFPYARHHLATYLTQHLSGGALAPELATDLAALRAEHATDLAQGNTPPLWQEQTTEKLLESAIGYLYWLMDQDRKSTPLKSLQGKLWEEGYRKGELLSEVFADVAPALESWQRQQRQIAIYSSGSVLAQQLLFAHTHAGDLTRFLSHYFDTHIGGKTQTESYQRIAERLALPTQQIVFVSDVTTELAAASQAGMQVVLSLRPGNRPQPDAESFPSLHSFAELLGSGA